MGAIGLRFALRAAHDPAVTDAMWLDAARRHFRDQVIVGKDLLEI